MKLHHINDFSPFPTYSAKDLIRCRLHRNGKLLQFVAIVALFALAVGLCPAIAVADCIVPIALWKLDEGESATTYPETYNPGSNSGICRQEEGVSVCPQADDGRYGNGQRFYTNGNHTGIDIPASPIFDWQNKANFSLAFWMKRDAAPFEDNEVIIGRDSKEENNDLHWWVGLGTDGAARAIFADINKLPLPHGTKYLRGDKLLTDNIWHFIVFVRDGVASENRLYVDGALEEKKIFTHDTPNAFAAPVTDINIGWLNLSQGYYYKGMVDEIALYNVALPQWFIRDRYHADRRYPSDQTDPCD